MKIIDDFNNIFNNYLKRISPQENAKKVILYGAGNFGQSICSSLLNMNIEVLFFLDIKAIDGQRINDIPVFHPSSSIISSKDKQEIPIWITIHNRETNLAEIICELQKFGFINIRLPVNYVGCFQDKFERFWLTDPRNYSKWYSEINQGYSLFHDERSKYLYLALLNQRITGNYACLPLPDLNHQYFPLDLPSWESPLRFIDCGAYNGDNLHSMKNGRIEFETIVGFEPDPENFSQLIKNISNIGCPTFLFPCGVYSSTKQLKFKNNEGEGSRLSNEGGFMIQTVALDDVLWNYHPNLIKMDIEGAENEALLGAKKIISRDQPGLAISSYHCPQHLWQLPKIIETWDLGYQFYLRAHAYNGFDVVLYAVPLKRN